MNANIQLEYQVSRRIYLFLACLCKLWSSLSFTHSFQNQIDKKSTYTSCDYTQIGTLLCATHDEPIMFVCLWSLPMNFSCILMLDILLHVIDLRNKENFDKELFLSTCLKLKLLTRDRLILKPLYMEKKK